MNVKSTTLTAVTVEILILIDIIDFLSLMDLSWKKLSALKSGDKGTAQCLAHFYHMQLTTGFWAHNIFQIWDRKENFK